MLGRKMIWRIASCVLLLTMVLMGISILTGAEIKGATRWIQFMGFSLQPSEFAKPAFAVTAAWLIARRKTDAAFPGHALTLGLFAMLLTLLMLQPDLGMSFVVSCSWGSLIFMSGLPMIWIFGLIGLGVGGLFLAYLIFPHVTKRVDLFLDPAGGDNFQVQKSLDAFANGGLLGTGPGHGEVKLLLPDAHADFIFSVAGEEFGMIATLLLVLLFAFILWRCIARIITSDDLFVTLGSGALITQFCVQSFVHMGSSLQILPAKGMTLPFISYGGSSLLAMGLGMGMLLSLTRRRMSGATKIIARRALNHA
jgi:cell division protein FtsW